MASFTASLAQLVAENPRVTLWMLRVPDEFAKLHKQQIHHASIYLRLDTLRLYQPQAIADLPQLASHITNLTLVDSHYQITHCANMPSVKFANVPFWRWKIWQVGDKRQRVDIFIDTAQQLKLAEAIVDYLVDLCPEWSQPHIVVPTSNDISFAASNRNVMVAVDTLMNSFVKLGNLPAAVIDLSGGTAEFAPYRETLARFAIPMLDSDCPAGFGMSSPATLSGLFEGITTLVNTLDVLSDEAEQRDKSCYGHDAGWNAIWREFSIRNVLT
jgi:hypothetical protein